MKGYKLTDQYSQTHGGCQWGAGVTNEITIPGNDLCTNQVFHVYLEPLLAVFANPINGDYDLRTALLWECECSEPVNSDALKVGVKKCTTLKQIPVPAMSLEQRIEIGIRCAMQVYKAAAFNEWAENWLSGKDRTRQSANAVACYAAFYAAAEASYAAAEASYAATAAAHIGHYSYKCAAYVAAAYAAVYSKIDILEIIEKVMGVTTK